MYIMNTLKNAKRVKKLVEITNPISGKPIKNTGLSISKNQNEIMNEIIENFFPNNSQDTKKIEKK